MFINFYAIAKQSVNPFNLSRAVEAWKTTDLCLQDTGQDRMYNTVSLVPLTCKQEYYTRIVDIYLCPSNIHSSVHPYPPKARRQCPLWRDVLPRVSKRRSLKIYLCMNGDIWIFIFIFIYLYTALLILLVSSRRTLGWRIMPDSVWQ